MHCSRLFVKSIYVIMIHREIGWRSSEKYRVHLVLNDKRPPQLCHDLLHRCHASPYEVTVESDLFEYRYEQHSRPHRAEVPLGGALMWAYRYQQSEMLSSLQSENRRH